MTDILETELTMLQILKYGHPVLHRKAEEITDITEDIVRIAANMSYTMHAAPGIGLAAPQVEHSLRLITADISVGEKKHELFILINPKITAQEGECEMEEGCLSLPSINEKVLRPFRVQLQGYDLTGKELSIEAEGLLARVFCHEIDHLNGKLFIDHLSPLKKNLARKKMQKMLINENHS